MITIKYSEYYLQKKLEWVEQRMAALAEIEAKLREMKSLAAYAGDNCLNGDAARAFNERINALQQEISVLDDQTKVFPMDCH